MLDSLTVPRRPYDFEDYVDILRRNLRWIIAPTFAGLVISTVVAFFMPDVFFSMATDSSNAAADLAGVNPERHQPGCRRSDQQHGPDHSEPQHADQHHQPIRALQERTQERADGRCDRSDA